jgi:hypothetical protein
MNRAGPPPGKEEPPTRPSNRGHTKASDRRYRRSQLNASSVGKSTPRAQFDDTWLRERIPWIAAEVTRLDGGPIARLYLKKARAAFRQFRRFGSPRQRHLCWRYLQQTAVQLAGRPARSSEQLTSQGEKR